MEAYAFSMDVWISWGGSPFHEGCRRWGGRRGVYDLEIADWGFLVDGYDVGLKFIGSHC